jgi:hypothetical protein
MLTTRPPKPLMFMGNVVPVRTINVRVGALNNTYSRRIKMLLLYGKLN